MTFLSKILEYLNQDSCLQPVLFLMYAAELFKVVDTQLYVSFKQMQLILLSVLPMDGIEAAYDHQFSQTRLAKISVDSVTVSDAKPITSLQKFILGPFHVTDITSGEQNFGNETIFYKLTFCSFYLKFVQISLTWYLTSSRKETLISFTNAANMLVLNSVTDITKKSTYDFLCSLDTTIPVN